MLPRQWLRRPASPSAKAGARGITDPQSLAQMTVIEEEKAKPR